MGRMSYTPERDGIQSEVFRTHLGPEDGAPNGIRVPRRSERERELVLSLAPGRDTAEGACL